MIKQVDLAEMETSAKFDGVSAVNLAEIIDDLRGVVNLSFCVRIDTYRELVCRHIGNAFGLRR